MLVLSTTRAYGLAIALSSFLLFLVQPFMSQAILPWFGGGTLVWSTALVFFQALLLIGYVYAHLLVRLPVKTQVLTHAVLMLGALLSLPILPDLALKPAPNAEPTTGVLWVLLLSVGLPYALLSTTTPLLQAWFTRLPNTDSPYRFYALSNAASLIALFAYPFLLQPLLSLSGQSWMFSICLVLTTLALGYAGWLLFRLAQPQTIVEAADKPRLTDIMRWTAYAALGSALFMSVSNQLTLDIAPTPFLWVFPLAIYLLSFVFAFAKDLWYDQAVTAILFAFTLFISLLTMTKSGGLPTSILVTPILVMLFFGCLLCHAQLAASKPKPSGLTLFYFCLSLGGVLGGLFVAILAPRIFEGYWELPLVEMAVVLVAVSATLLNKSSAYYFLKRPVTALASLSLMIGIVQVMTTHIHQFYRDTIFVDRTPYGVLRVKERNIETDDHSRELLNGSTTHGDQYLADAYRQQATSYYGPSSGVGRLLTSLAPAATHIGVIGLGTGTLAVYTDAQDSLTFYEIDPAVETIARSLFTYINEAAGTVNVVIGDARLSLEASDSQQFDVLAIDAFSSDAIPVHLLTAEAFDVYAKHLADDGVLAIHISNRHLDLLPVVVAGAHHVQMPWREVSTDTVEAHESGNTWVLVSNNEALLNSLAPAENDATQNETTAVVPWSDSYSSILPLLRL